METARSIHMRHRRRRWLSVSALLVLLPVAVLLAVLLQKRSGLRTHLISGFRDPSNASTALRAIPYYALTCLENYWLHTGPPTNRDVFEVRIQAAAGTLAEFDKAIGDENRDGGEQKHSDTGKQPYRSAWIQLGDEAAVECKIALRGASIWHHLPEKPSLRVKLSKKQNTTGYRFIELSRPEDPLALANYVPAKLASGVGVLSEMPRHVRLYINGRYFGLYLMTFRAEEGLTIAAARLPGTFFKDDHRSGFEGDLWTGVMHWKATGDTTNDLSVFGRFLQAVNETEAGGTFRHLERFLDFDAYARYAAVMILAGGKHSDDLHNQVFYLDSTHGLLEPVVWDANGFGFNTDPCVPPDVVPQPSGH